jgi:hypothetical protein
MYACVLFREKNRSSSVLGTQKNRLSVKAAVSRRSALFLLRHCQCPNLSLRLLLCLFCFGRVCEEQGIDARHDGPKIPGIREEIDAEISTVSRSMLKSSQVKSTSLFAPSSLSADDNG